MAYLHFIPLLVCTCIGYVVATTLYNLFFHPLANHPGPFLARISPWPNFYHAVKGDRHIWLWQQFQIYGRKFRAAPNTVFFRSLEAHGDIFNHKSNVRKSNFYEAWVRDEKHSNTLNTVDVALHAQKRRLLNLAFTEQSVKAAGPIMAEHIDRWNEILVMDTEEEGWSQPRDMSTWVDYLVFDVIGDLCFGENFKTKEPAENPLKEIPHTLMKYIKALYPISKSPWLPLLLWLKSHGLNRWMEKSLPERMKNYYDLLEQSVDRRLEMNAKSKSPVREDMLYFLSSAEDPDTNQPAFTRDDLLSESHLLIIAGSDTTAVTMCGLFFFLTHNPRVYDKLADEIRTTFASLDEIVHGPKLHSCNYLRAVIQEALRMAPAGPSELPRVVRKGGQSIDGTFYREGTVVGTPQWALYRNEEFFGNDAYTFRPERWIPSTHPDTLNPEAEVQRLKRGFHPFSKGPGNCVGQNLALLQLSLLMARTLLQSDFRFAPGQTVGEGKPELGWGRRDPMHYQMADVFIGYREGPVIQFRGRQAGK